MRNRTTWEKAHEWAWLLVDDVGGGRRMACRPPLRQGERGRYGCFLGGDAFVGEGGRSVVMRSALHERQLL